MKKILLIGLLTLCPFANELKSDDSLATPKYTTIILSDNQELMGELLEKTESTTTIKLGSGGVFTIDNSNIKESKIEKGEL